MFYVTSIDGSQVEPLINIGNDFKMDLATDGTFTVSFSCFPGDNNPGYDLLQSEAVITVDGYDFRVKQYSNSTYSKSIVADSIFYDHIKTQQHNIFSGSHTVANHAEFALRGTAWTFTVENELTNATNYINKFGSDNVVSLINKICKYHDCEFMILPDKKIHFAKQIGPDHDYQYRYKHNVQSVVLKEDTTNLATFIRGFGADGLEVSYTSPNAGIFGELEETAVRDERFTIAQSLLDYIITKLQDEPELAIESTIPELVERAIGERVWVIYEPIGIELQTRILQQTKVLRNGKLITSSVVWGNSLPKSSMDLLLDQQDQIKETNDYIEDTKEEINTTIETTKEEINETIDNTVRDINFKFHETDTKIIDQYQTVTSEYTASISANARQIRTEMSEHVTTINNSMGAQYSRITEEYNSSITQTAREIRTDVTASITSVNANIQNVQNYASSISQTAQQIQSQVSSQQTIIDSQGTRIANAESSITQTASQIQSQINSQQTIIDSQGTRISYAESSITQQANQIALKVNQTDFTGRTVSSLIMQDPYSISLTADKLNLTGAVVVNGSVSGATNISVTTDLHAGNSLYLNGGGDKAVRFATSHVMETASGELSLHALYGIRLGFNTRFEGNVDFSGANVTGLPAPTNVNAASVGGYTMSHSVAGGKTFITFRQNGSYLGQLELTA